MAEIEITEDKGIWPVMTALLDCLQEEFETRALGPISILGILPGDAIAVKVGFDDDDCLQVWVRMVQSYVSAQFPQQETVRTNIHSPMAYRLEVGAIRCVSVGEEDGNGPTSEEMFNEARLQMADMAALKQAICTCLKTVSKRDYQLDVYTPFPYQGGVAGGSWDVLVGSVLR